MNRNEGMVKEERIRGGLAISISAIVSAEVLQRISDAGFLQDGHVARLLKVLLYAAGTLGYPTVFFLLGVSTLASLQRSRARLLKSLASTVLYPYLLWSILQMAVQWLVADYQDYPAQQFELARLAWAPIGQFWFLYALFICQIVAFVTLWPRPTTVRCALTVANRSLIVAMILASATVAIRSRWGIVTMTCWGLVFFLAGVLLASRPDRQESHASGVYVALASAIAFGAAAFMGQRFGHHLDLYSLLTSFLGVAAALSVGRCLPIWRRSRWIVLIGLTWKPIYLMHVLATALVWNALLAFGIGHPVVHFVLGSAVGLTLPIAIYVLAKRLRVASWAGFAETAAARSEGAESSGKPAPRADKSAKSRV
ncbi:acyltransferase family protein [Paraburkholderia dipogonis]|nr:acyltransferase [Paraburkholderia dipogonis]